ncbi:MAG: FtsX-like permease family protein [Candidatus Nomurabacteria bacterium]|nr:FtsX-like permease family protein [Candidatus Nomurabacteria bacterium]
MSSLHQRLPFNRRMIMKKRMLGRGLANLIRNSWLTMAAIVVMLITLLTIFISATATLALNGTVDQTRREKSDLSVFLKSDTPENIYEALRSELISDNNVVQVDIVDSAQQSTNLNDVIDDETRAIIRDMELDTASMLPIRIGIRVADIDDLDSVREIVTDDLYMAYMDPNSYDYQFYNGDNSKVIDTINRWARYAQTGGMVLGGIFLLISILVIFNTIRMAIFARKDEIEMEKLIGAEPRYIRGPFLVEAELYGIIAGSIAAALGYALLWWVVPILSGAGIATGSLTDIVYGWAPLVVIGVILLGVFIGELSARMAVRKYLRY